MKDSKLNQNIKIKFKNGSYLESIKSNDNHKSKIAENILIGCKYCDYDSDDCCIFVDSLDGEYYLDIETSEWDEYDDGYVHCKEYINYCPYCGRKLGK